MKNYYFRGKFFATFEELLTYCKFWNSMEVTEESATMLLEIFNKDVILNLMLTDRPKMSNIDFQNIINVLFETYINELQKVEIV